MKQFSSELQGPFDMKGENSFFVNSVGELTGIYFWAVRGNQGNHIHYVGITNVSYRERTKDHLFLQLRGEYSIIDMDLAREDTYKQLWPGYYGASRSNKRDEIVEFNNFLMRYEELLPHLMLYLTDMKLFILPFQKSVDRRQLELLEGNIARTLWNDISIGFLARELRYKYRLKSNEEPITFEIEGNSQLIGLRPRYQITHE